MLVSIIIVNYNGIQFLEECLSSIHSITYPEYEVILIDNHSSDDSVGFVKEKFPNVRIKKLKQNYGFAKANNIGAEIARGELLLFLNNDTKVTEGFLEPLIAEIKPDKIAICQSLLLKPDGAVDSAGDFIDKYGRAFSSRVVPERTSPILSARGACMLVKNEVFWILGGFDEKFFVSFEDVDIGWRAWIFGYKVIVVPESIVYHYGSGTISKISERIKFHGVKNSFVLRLTNFEWKFSFISIITLFFVIFVKKIFQISIITEPEMNHTLPSMKTMLKAGIWIIKNFNYIINKRKKISSIRIVSTSELIKKQLVSKV